MSEWKTTTQYTPYIGAITYYCEFLDYDRDSGPSCAIKAMWKNKSQAVQCLIPVVPSTSMNGPMHAKLKVKGNLDNGVNGFFHLNGMHLVQ